jgi:hypothetical protein
MYTSALQCCAFVIFSEDVPRLLYPRSDLAMRIPRVSRREAGSARQAGIQRVQIRAFLA